MKRQEEWRPSKFVAVNGRYRASRDPKEVAPASRLITDRLAVVYEAALRQHARGALLDLGCGQVPLFGVYRGLVSASRVWTGRRVVRSRISISRRTSMSLFRFRKAALTPFWPPMSSKHVSHPRRMFREISRLLRRKGP